MSERVRVRRNQYGPDRDEHRWHVTCDWCSGGDMFGAFLGRGFKGWAKTWREAQEYAANHALGHEQTRCPTCLHVPMEPLPSERKADA